MASDALLPNPCLLAILLVVKINSEPRIVFHYPPRPGEDNSHFTRYLAAQDKDRGGSSSTDDDSTSSNGEEMMNSSKPKAFKTGDSTPELDVEETGSVSPEKTDIWNDQYGKPKWNDVFGLRSYGLARLLCPPPTSHEQRFELSIDDKVFVGRPIFAREGEEWKKKKVERRKRDRKSGTDSEMTRAQGKGMATQSTATSAQITEESTDASEHDERSGNGLEIRNQASSASRPGQPAEAGKTPLIDAKESKPKKKATLNMFHVVFVLNPPPLEYHLRVKEMYDHAIKRFSKALKREQARSNYVMREISSMFKDAPHIKSAHSKADQYGKYATI
ncbi:MAG: hypothetical protein Q9166_001926 [cf. Caloplaca sp. 2 TL-2023]